MKIVMYKRMRGRTERQDGLKKYRFCWNIASYSSVSLGLLGLDVAGQNWLESSCSPLRAVLRQIRYVFWSARMFVLSVTVHNE